MQLVHVLRQKKSTQIKKFNCKRQRNGTCVYSRLLDTPHVKKFVVTARIHTKKIIKL